MATTVLTVQNKVNQFLHGDTSTNSVSAADRLAAITTSVQELITEFGFDNQNATQSISYLDSVHTYNLTSSNPNFTEPIDLRRDSPYHNDFFTRKNPRDLAVEIDNGTTEPSFGIERKDQTTNLVVNFQPRFKALSIHPCDSLTSNGTWAADAVNSDATTASLAVDTVDYKEGSASLIFNITVAQSVNNRATLSNSTLTPVNLTTDNGLSSWVMWVKIPDVTYFTSVTFYWGSSSTAYWSATVTTDLSGAAWKAGWNRIKFDWSSATKTSTPDVTLINYLRIDYNYSASQADATGFHLDDIKLCRPENLTLFYESSYVGANSGGTKLFAFTATSDVPFYSGMYDYFDNVVAHRSAAILFAEMGLGMDAQAENAEVEKAKKNLMDRFPSSRLTETQNFKVRGLNWNRRRIRRTG